MSDIDKEIAAIPSACARLHMTTTTLGCTTPDIQTPNVCGGRLLTTSCIPHSRAAVTGHSSQVRPSKLRPAPFVLAAPCLPNFSPLRRRTIPSRVHSKRLDKLSSTPGRHVLDFSLSEQMALMRDGRLARLGPWRNVLELVG
jgi:hypothetical protein